jgi:hypothetical protein
VEEAPLASRFDGDDGRAGLLSRVREDAHDVETRLLETVDDGDAQDVGPDDAGGGDLRAELRHRDAGVADVAAGRQFDRLEELEPAGLGGVRAG